MAKTLSALFALFLSFSCSDAFACSLGYDSPPKWPLWKVAQKSEWIVEGKVFEEVIQDLEVQYIILPETVFKGKRELSYRTGFFMYASYQDEILPFMDTACRMNVNLKTGKSYIFFSFPGNILSVMEADQEHRDLVKKALSQVPK
ncbi:hypothetical protein [Bdellovibrio sp. HCB-162]|uniref:hypothetical protein n=1 Tax=Bdellovibrio sp. HCB-162 TaxID=3394234 RepID=UPI0039BC8640